MKTGENIDNALDWLKKNTSKLSAKRAVDPLMFMLADLEGFPILEIDKLGLKEDPTLLAGFLAAIESFSQRLFGKTGMLQYMVAGDYKYIVKTDDKGQYPEDEPNLKYMFDWWGEKCVNPEYEIFRKKFAKIPDLK